MSGYWIIFASEVIDQEAQKEYGRLWGPISEKYDAKIKVLDQGALVETQGSSRVLVVEFPSYSQAKACYEDPAYVEAKSYALRAAKREVLITEGEFAW
ncbi:DUF1330 domain-containing protein [Halomonas campaniensis]|jgi:uncharacterized protein (DUF1330 family)|uniref:DUF1330 domain-containing protein n=1 Tax=Halomonas campaniensis TaxID=213554 RepID=A0A246RZX9_9GAMM|nr:DUF1330 domain-containing protein [Halomonas campaniensis]OWV29732.1 hypothetical protein JI62_10790 [Halomonas campaniensis]